MLRQSNCYIVSKRHECPVLAQNKRIRRSKVYTNDHEIVEFRVLLLFEPANQPFYAETTLGVVIVVRGLPREHHFVDILIVSKLGGRHSGSAPPVEENEITLITFRQAVLDYSSDCRVSC